MTPRDHKAMRAVLAANPFCRVCGTTTGLDCHHVVNRSLSQRGAENEDNLIVLCRSCHDSVHGKEIDLQSYLSTAEQAHAVLMTGSLELARKLLCPSAYATSGIGWPD